MKHEYLFDSKENRRSIFPIKYPDIWEMYKEAEKSHWVPEEVDMSSDKYNELSEGEKKMVLAILCFFSEADNVVAENLSKMFVQEVQVPEAKFYYDFQTAMENLHSNSYSLQIDTYIKDLAEKDKAFNAISNYSFVAKKAEWAIKWINTNNSFAERLVAFACVEGILFSASFCCIYYLKTLDKMPGLCKFNEFIQRDETHHTMFAVLLYNSHIQNKLSKERVLEIIEEAVEIEKTFVDEVLSIDMIGMNKRLMKQYVESVADGLLNLLGVEPIYNSNNPFGFMENISLSRKTNFFERRVSEYQKSGGQFSLDEEF